ncbi:MAG: hypothetical protein HY369_00790, partial [Candidatus Aenigmarchaeota archaeon]|nr:hypothetical protein [Candidatus Aenigmarchaeota archaeon]
DYLCVAGTCATTDGSVAGYHLVDLATVSSTYQVSVFCPAGGVSSPISLNIASFSATPSLNPAGIQFTYNVEGLQPGSIIIIKGWKQGTIPPLDETTFSTTGGEDLTYTHIPSGISSSDSFEDFMPEAKKTYTFYLMACNPGLPCMLSPATDVTTNGGNPNGNISAIIGIPEVVFDHDNQKCVPDTDPDPDIPDMPARAMRVGNSILITRTHTNSRMMIGSTFDSLYPNCTIVLNSTLDKNLLTDAELPVPPESFAHKEWISSTYYEPNTNIIHMIVHNEFHDPNKDSNLSTLHPCTVYKTIPGNPCNYFSLTYASATPASPISTNMFKKKTDWQTNKDSLIVGASHMKWPGDPIYDNPPPSIPNNTIAPVMGMPMTSNIIKRGSHYYMLSQAIQASPSTNQWHGTCIARTNDLSNASSWRFWNGSHYSIRMGSPYEGKNGGPCANVAKNEIQNMMHSLTWNEYLGKYLLVSSQNNGGPNPDKCGFYFSLSDDLINWTARQLLWEVPLTTGPCKGTPNEPTESRKTYPSIIDHSSPSLNFETSGKNPYLYYTDYVGVLVTTIDRDLARVPIIFCDSVKEACGT